MSRHVIGLLIQSRSLIHLRRHPLKTKTSYIHKRITMSLPLLIVKGHAVRLQLTNCYQKVYFRSLTQRSFLNIGSPDKCMKVSSEVGTTSQPLGVYKLSHPGICKGRQSHLGYVGHRFLLLKDHALSPIRRRGLSTTATACRQEKPFGHSDKNFDKKNDKFQYKTWKVLLTVPNFLTFSRVLLTPYLGYLVICQSYTAACGLFLFAGITDVLDGWIARRFPSQASPIGSFMDPLADKFLISTLFITLSVVNLIPAPLTFLVILRDVSLIAAAFYVRIISLAPPVTLTAILDPSSQTAELKPTLISKANTAIQLSLVVLTLGAPVVNCVDHPVLQVLWCVTAVTTLWSGIGYIFAKNTFTLFKQRRLTQKQL